MIELRPYQQDVVDRTRLALRANPSVCLVLPCRSGKTVIAASMLHTTRSRGRRAWFLAHRDFLLEQTSKTFDREGLPHAFIAAGRHADQFEPIQICSVQTAARRLKRYTPPDLFVWDECHHCLAATYRKIFEWAPNAKHIGLTATPCRLDGKGLDKYFASMVLGPTVAQLIEWGYLSRYRAFAPTIPNLSGIHTVAGDYNQGELADVMDTSQIIGDMVRHYREKANGKRAVYFAVSIKHSQHITASFLAAGIGAAHLDGDSSTEERLSTARAFARGDIKIISNVSLMDEGFDLASQTGAEDATIEAVGLARPTQSLTLHVQQMMRALTKKDEPAIILDHAGNLARGNLGLPDDDRAWSLQGIDRKRRQESAPGVRQCGKCFGVVRAGVRVCPYCQAVFEIQAREVEEVAGPLAEIDVEALRAARQAEQKAARDYHALVGIARQRGYRKPEEWARHIIANRDRGAQKRIEHQAQAYLRL